MSRAVMSEGWWGRRAFSLCCAIYALLWLATTWFLCRTFGGDLGTAILSLVLLTPLLVAARMRWRWALVWYREFLFLTILTICALTGGGYIISSWYDKCFDLTHAAEVRFAELDQLVRQDPTFCNVKLRTPLYRHKDSYHIRGTVASRADFERLQALARQFGFSDEMKDVEVLGEQTKASK